MKQCNSPFIVKYYGRHFNDEELWVGTQSFAVAGEGGSLWVES
jgi:hypothetical protein